MIAPWRGTWAASAAAERVPIGRVAGAARSADMDG